MWLFFFGGVISRLELFHHRAFQYSARGVFWKFSSVICCPPALHDVQSMFSCHLIRISISCPCSLCMLELKHLKHHFKAPKFIWNFHSLWLHSSKSSMLGLTARYIIHYINQHSLYLIAHFRQIPWKFLDVKGHSIFGIILHWCLVLGCFFGTSPP